MSDPLPLKFTCPKQDQDAVFQIIEAKKSTRVIFLVVS